MLNILDTAILIKDTAEFVKQLVLNGKCVFF